MATALREPPLHPEIERADRPGDGATAGPGATRRMAPVDGLRALAAIWVAAYHATFEFVPHWQDGPVATIVLAGHLGVPIFLVLSGFCLAYPSLSKGRFRVEPRSFAIRRALRLLPPYYLVMGGLIALQQLPFFAEKSGPPVTDLRDTLAHVFLVHNLWPDHIWRIDGPQWSIALESQLYLLFPLLLLAMKRPWMPMIGALAIATAWWLAVPQLLGPHPDDATTFTYWSALPSMLPLFVLGMAVASLLVQPRRIPAWVTTVGVALLVAGVIADRFVDWPMAAKLIMGLGTGLVLLLPSGRLGRILGWRPLVRIGEVSFTLYLTHNPVLNLVGRLTAGHVHGLALTSLACAAVALTVVVALLVAPVIERPFHQLARRLTRPA